MLIKAVLSDGCYITVSQEVLDRLLEHNRVKCFERRSGWAVVGVQPIRLGHNHNNYTGRERRYLETRH